MSVEPVVGGIANFLVAMAGVVALHCICTSAYEWRPGLQAGQPSRDTSESTNPLLDGLVVHVAHEVGFGEN